MLKLENDQNPSKKQKTNVKPPGIVDPTADGDGKANDGEESKDDEFSKIAEYERQAEKEWKDAQLKALKKNREAIEIQELKD